MREQEVRSVIADPHSSQYFSTKWIMLSFLGVVFLLLFFAFSGLDLITGAVIFNGEGTDEPMENISTTDKFKFYAELERPAEVIELKQKLERIEMNVVGVNNKVYFGKEGVSDLSGLGTAKIVLEDFDGTFSFDGDSIYLVKGEASKLIINDFPPTTSIDGSIKVRIEEGMNYDFLKIEGVFIKNYETNGTGTLSFDSGKVSMELTDEFVLVEEFRGTLTSGASSDGSGVVTDGLILDGLVTTAKVGGGFDLTLGKKG